MYMELTEKQINTIDKLFRKHIHASEKEKFEIERNLKKYGFNSSGEVYKFLKNIRSKI